MKSFARIAVIAILIVAGVFVAQQLSPNSTPAQDENNENNQPAEGENQDQAENESEDKTNEESEAENKDETTSSYSYTAQSGDSYAKIARKAVQTYGINNNVSLSEAQIIAAETYISSDAGFPELNLGQTVELSDEAVKAAVEKAEALDDAAIALWQRYVGGADFNTDNVGEAR